MTGKGVVMRAGFGSIAATSAAVVSAGAIAVTPIAPPLPERIEPAIQLAASSDWSVILGNAGQGAAALVNSAFNPPFPVLQQSIANQLRYLSELPDVAGIAAQIATNIARGITAPFAPTTDTLDAQHEFLYNALPIITALPLVDLLFQISPTGQQLLDFSTSPFSGALLGLAGPIVAPIFVLGANIGSIVADLAAATPDPGRALSTFFNTPAQMVDAFLNGGVHVDVTDLATALGPAIGVSFPPGTKVGIAFGGLFSAGGSIFNALDMDYEQDIVGLPLIRVNLATGQGPGFIGSLIEMNKAIARAIGWSGTGSPLAPPESQSGTSSLAAVDEVPRSVLSSQVVSLGTSTDAAESVADQEVQAPAVDDAAVHETTDPTTTPVPETETKDGAEAAPDDAAESPSEGGKHRAKPGQSSFGDRLGSTGKDSDRASAKGFARHARQSEDDDSAESGRGDKPAKAEKAEDKADDESAKAKSDDSGSDTE